MATEFTQTSRMQWEGVAREWGARAEELEEGPPGQATAWVLDAADLQAGESVLELACGPAELGLRAAHAVGPRGRALLTDFSDGMVAEARRRAEAAGLDNVETRVMDATSLDLPDESFDAVLCRFGYMLMERPDLAMAETARVLRPGGRVGLAVWDELERNPWVLSVMRAVAEHFDAPPPDSDAPGMARFADPGKLRGLLEGAGLTDVRIERIEGRERHESVDVWWERTSSLAGPLKMLFSNLPEDARTAIRERAETNAAEFRAEDGSVEFPAAIRVAVARRP